MLTRLLSTSGHKGPLDNQGVSPYPSHGASLEKVAAEDAAIKIYSFQDNAPFLLLFAEQIACDAPSILILYALKHLPCTDLIGLPARLVTPSRSAF